MTPAAPRLDARLIAAIAHLDRRGTPIAETNRRLGVVAKELGLPRPSYEHVRRIVHLLRAEKRHPGVGSVLLDIAFRVRPPEALLEAIVERRS